MTKTAGPSALLLLAAWLPFWPLGCEAEPTDATGGETHFLRVCDASPEACGTALSCLCGVCTVACQIEESCAAFPGATCTTRADATCGAPSNVCEAPCTDDDDCTALSLQHRCVAGACRLDPSATDGLGGSSGSTGGTSSSCVEDATSANEVLVMGDSFFATSHQITAYLEDLARSASALDAGERYRDSSRLTSNALALSSYGILDQYREAQADSTVRVVVMNGGGADALLGSCDADLAGCPVLTAAAAALDDVLATMATDGVLGVVFAGYPDPQVEAVRAKMDVLRPLLEDSCARSSVPCHWLDLRATFADNYETYVLADGMNPTALGSEASASAIWALMEQHCLAQ